jgi:hypothetical protein
MSIATISEMDQLFKRAAENGGSDYLYSLVRIDGIQMRANYQDELVALRDWLGNKPEQASQGSYSYLTSLNDPLNLLQNLVNNLRGQHYHIRPFMPLGKAIYSNAVRPNQLEKASTLSKDLAQDGLPGLSALLDRGYRVDLTQNVQVDLAELQSSVDSLTELFDALLQTYFAARLQFKDVSKYIKLPNSLDVLELLTDDEFGLFGLRVHFPQGCTAEFSRTKQGVFGTNVEFGPPVCFLMMSMSPSTNEYRVNGKRLYEIGLPGRYNKLGEWKPLIYPAESEHLVQECTKLSEDPNVQGALLYLLLTGHRCIEFVLKSNMELPGQLTSTRSNDLHIWKCPPNEDPRYSSHLRIYDCWLELKSANVDEVEAALTNIGRLVNLMCFPYGAEYSWRNKYRTTTPTMGTLALAEEDLQIADSVIRRNENFDTSRLELAIDWYNQGNISSNVFTRFLCYYIALESAAMAIVNEGRFGQIVFERGAKREQEQSRADCIKGKYRDYFESNPTQFAIESYFECVQTLTAKTKKAVAAVFGAQHQFYEWLFDKTPEGGIALSKLRSQLVHGEKTLLTKEHNHLVRKHLFQMETVVKEFLMRIWLSLSPTDSVPSWSGAFKMTFSTSDPRSTLVASTEKVFPSGTSWKIRPEWCDL